MDILNRKLIKAEAKSFISQDRKWLTMALACLPLFLINGAISGGFNFVLNFSEDGDVSSSSFSSGSSFVAWLLVPFMIGAAGYFLNHLRGMNPDWKSLYREGLDNYGTYFKVGVVTEIFIVLWTFVFIIPGIIKTYKWFFILLLLSISSHTVFTFLVILFHFFLTLHDFKHCIHIHLLNFALIFDFFNFIIEPFSFFCIFFLSFS